MFATLATQSHPDTEEKNKKLAGSVEPATETCLDLEVVALKKTG